MLPNFFIVGAQKSGTTALYNYLEHHPQVFMPEIKEPHFFASDWFASKGLPWYERLFEGSEGAEARGEASTSYTMYPYYTGVPERLLAVVPNPRLIYLMRDPVARVRSAYQHAVARGSERRPFQQAVLEDGRYLLPTSYALQLEQWLPHVGRDAVLLLTAEQLRSDRAATLRRVLEFLGVDPDWQPHDLAQDHHVSAEKRAPRPAWQRVLARTERHPRLAHGSRWLHQRGGPVLTRAIDPADAEVTDALRARLAGVLQPDLLRLRELVGGGFDCWGHAPADATQALAV